MPQLFAQFPQMIATMQNLRTSLLTMHGTMSGIFDQMDEMSESATTMGKAFDAAKNDDSFYLPPEVFTNPDFKRVMDMFLSPDGKAARFIISHRGDPTSPEGTARVDQIKTATEEALKGTPLENATIYLAGTSALVKDVADGSKYDLLVAGVAALCLIFIIMLIMTRSFIAALVIVGTVAISLGASFGLSVLVWQYIVGLPIHWMVLAMSVIILLAVGSDYNLLLVSRMKEEIAAGINTGIIRAMGGTGKVVTWAGLVFAFTMASMVVSDLRVVGQIGTTIGLGLLFDTLVVRAFMTPSIAALLGRWFWWPQAVRPRPASQMLRPGPRPLVRACCKRTSERRMSTGHRQPPFIARTIRGFSPFIILAWVALILIVTLASVGGNWAAAIPSLERVARQHSVSLMPKDAPAVQAMARMGKAFEESDSDSFAMIVLEGRQPLGDDVRRYYAGLVRELRNDPQHVEHVQDLWGDRLTETSVQSPDGKAVYVQLNLAGNQGTTLGDESVAAVRNIVNRAPPPAGVDVYVTGPAPLVSDTQHSGNRSILKITAVTVVIILTMLLLVYRSIVTVILLLVMVGVELTAARGIVAFLGHHDILELSTFAINMLIFLSIAAGTDYGYSSSGGIKKHVRPARTRKRPTTPPIAGSVALSWRPD